MNQAAKDARLAWMEKVWAVIDPAREKLDPEDGVERMVLNVFEGYSRNAFTTSALKRLVEAWESGTWVRYSEVERACRRLVMTGTLSKRNVDGRWVYELNLGEGL